MGHCPGANKDPSTFLLSLSASTHTHHFPQAKPRLQKGWIHSLILSWVSLQSLAHYFSWSIGLLTWDKFLSQRNETLIVQYQSPVRWGSAARWMLAGIGSPIIRVWLQLMWEAVPGLLGEAHPGLLPSHRIHFTILSLTLWRCWLERKPSLDNTKAPPKVGVLLAKGVRIMEFLSFKVNPYAHCSGEGLGIRYFLNILKQFGLEIRVHHRLSCLQIWWSSPSLAKTASIFGSLTFCRFPSHALSSLHHCSLSCCCWTMDGGLFWPIIF